MSNIILERDIYKKIYIIHGQRVMLDRDLAILYGVETRQLARQVRRNIERFPKEFMFQLTKDEFNNLKCQFGTSSWGGTRKLPLAFTEQGVAMLSSVLKSKKAIQVNIMIMKTFVKIRQYLLTHADLKKKIEELEKKYDKQFKVVFEAIRQLMTPPEEPKNKEMKLHFDRAWRQANPNQQHRF